MSKLELVRSCLKVAMIAESFQKRIPSGSVFFGEKLTTEFHILHGAVTATIRSSDVTGLPIP